MRPEHIVHFFRDVHGIDPITKEVFGQTDRRVPTAAGSLRRRVFHLQEHGTRSHIPFGAAEVSHDDPDYRIIKRNRSLYTHYYFYVRDEVLLRPAGKPLFHHQPEKTAKIGVAYHKADAAIQKNYPPARCIMR